MRIPVPFVGGSYLGQDENINAQRSINLLPVLDNEGGKKPLAMRTTSGLVPFAIASKTVARAALEINGTAYKVFGNTLFKINEIGTATAITGTLDDSTGFCQMESNGVDILIITDTGGYIHILGSASLAAVSDADFPDATSLTYQDGYYIVAARNTNQFYISGSLDGDSWDPLDFSSADGAPDYLVAVKSDHRELLLLCQKTFEVWWNSGNADFPFERISGGFITVGCGARDSVKESDNTIFWLDQNYRVRKIAGGLVPAIVSTRQIEHQFSTYSNNSKAKALSYVEKGHAFYVLIFDNDVWQYDVSTNLWIERTSGSFESKWLPATHCYCYGKNLFGDYKSNKIYDLDAETFTDNGETVRRTRTTQHLDAQKQDLIIDYLEVEFKAGIGLNTGQGKTPKAMLQCSRDGGKTWNAEIWRSVGAIGDYKYRAIWARIGRAHGQWTWRLIFTDPVDWVILGAYAKVRVIQK